MLLKVVDIVLIHLANPASFEVLDIDGDPDRHIDIAFTHPNESLGPYTYKLPSLSKCNRILDRITLDTVLFAPFIELNILLFLLQPLGHFLIRL